MQVQINVTKNDIRRGWAHGGIIGCPIALALRRKIEGAHVYSAWFYVRNLSFSLPEMAADFSISQSAWYKKGRFRPKPFSFYVDVPKEYLRIRSGW